MLKRSKECKKLARGQQDEGDRSREIGEEEGGGRIKTGACRRTVTREGERKTEEAGRRRAERERQRLVRAEDGEAERGVGEAERGTRNWQARENLGR